MASHTQIEAVLDFTQALIRMNWTALSIVAVLTIGILTGEDKIVNRHFIWSYDRLSPHLDDGEGNMTSIRTMFDDDRANVTRASDDGVDLCPEDGKPHSSFLCMCPADVHKKEANITMSTWDPVTNQYVIVCQPI